MEAGKRIYLDHAATTPVDPRVLAAMAPYWSDDFGNPGGIYKEGMLAKDAVAYARESIARGIGARADEVIFTSGGTEANNLALLGFAERLRDDGTEYADMHCITSAVEHPSVLDCFRELERRRARVSYIGVDGDGVLKIDEFEAALSPNTVLVSVMFANNEIGTLEPISLVAKALRDFRKNTSFPVFHTDASQAPLFFELNAEKLGVQLMTLDGQKIYGPKGIGILYARRGVPMKPLFFGGKQERRLRPGTENVPGIIGFAKAFAIAEGERERDAERVGGLRDYFVAEVLEKIPGAELNGDKEKRLPNNVNISFSGIDAEWLVIQLDAAGIAVGTKSACLIGENERSYVVRALGGGEARAESSIRFTLGRATAKEELDRVIDTLAQILTKDT